MLPNKGKRILIVLATLALTGPGDPQARATAPERPEITSTPEGPSEPARARTLNFAVEAPTERIACLVAAAAERERKARAVAWLGKELPPWPERCPIKVRITKRPPGGASTFTFDRGKVLSREMHVEGPLEAVLSGVLPHEVTHTIFADHFGTPVPRWADEGGALLSEDDRERKRWTLLASEILGEPRRAIPLHRLLPMKGYPNDVITLYAQGYSLTAFLVARKDRKTFLAFLKDGMKGDWDKAVHTHYGFRDVKELEREWTAKAGVRPPRETP
jgi:hypothetical protein